MGSVNGPTPLTGAPFRSVISNVIDADDVEALATAIPVWILPACPFVPSDSTYKRNAFPVATGTPASVTVTAPGL